MACGDGNATVWHSRRQRRHADANTNKLSASGSPGRDGRPHRSLAGPLQNRPRAVIGNADKMSRRIRRDAHLKTAARIQTSTLRRRGKTTAAATRFMEFPSGRACRSGGRRDGGGPSDWSTAGLPPVGCLVVPHGAYQGGEGGGGVNGGVLLREAWASLCVRSPAHPN